MKRNLGIRFILLLTITIVGCKYSSTKANNKTNNIEFNQIYTATIIDNSILEIQNEEHIKVFHFSWDEAQSIYSNADTIYPLGWDNGFKNYWFWSVTPTYAAYIAQYNVKNNIIKYYNAPEISGYNEYCFDPNKGLLVYSNYFIPQDKETRDVIEKQEIVLKCYDVINKSEIILDKQIGKKFSPSIDSGNIKYYLGNIIKTISE